MFKSFAGLAGRRDIRSPADVRSGFRGFAKQQSCALRSDDTDVRKEPRRRFGRSDCGKKLGKGG
jgi:hypothetical protein